MNSTNPERMNLPIGELLRAESCGGVMKFSRTMANGCRNRIGSRIAEAPSGVGAFRFRIYFSPQRIGAMTMIAVLILCGLLICLFRLDLDNAGESGLIPARNDVAKTRGNNVALPSRIMPAQLDISGTFIKTQRHWNR